MSNPMDFVFDGEYRRRPAQNLGGRRNTESRQEVVHRAQELRRARERDRQVASAIVVVQSYARSAMVRKKLQKERRMEFDSNKKATYTTDELGHQISLLNFFFHYGTDTARFHDFYKVILSHRKAILEKSGEDFIWSIRIRGILRTALTFLSQSNLHVYIRLFEEFTDDEDTSESSFNRLSYLWIHLVGRFDFFSRWRQIMEDKCVPLTSPQNDPLYPFAAACMTILRRPLNLVSTFVRKPVQNFAIGKFLATGSDVAHLILEKFTRSFADNVIHGYTEPAPPLHGVGTYLVLPYLARGSFPYAEWLRYLRTDKLEDCSTGRNILYTLLFLSTPFGSLTNTEEFFQAVLPLLPSIDPVINPLETPYAEDEPDDLDVDDSEWTASVSEAYKLYLRQTTAVLRVFVPILNSVPLVAWLNADFNRNWFMICPLLSTMVRFLGRKAAMQEYAFLSVLAYERGFMRNLYGKADCLELGDEFERNLANLFMFCCFFMHLTSTLHDAEFLQAIPMSRQQLEEFVIGLKDVYAAIVINDTYVQNYAVQALEEAITNTLLLLYERNTRMPLFPESIFLSNSLKAVSPVQTHNIEFADFATFRSQGCTWKTRNSSIDYKLLKILAQFPFCLSFHDRVSAWQRLLDLERSQRNQPYGLRELVQIRRSHIYEDAFEKLSPVNVPDMRDHFRISLVNIVGANEAGVDGGGLLREFLSEATKAGVDPNRGLFRLDTQNRVYPNPVAKKIDPKYTEHFYLMGRLVGKALYEQTLLELPLAAFFIQTCISGTIENAVDYLATLDSGLHKNLLALKTYNGDWNALGLDFTVTLEEFGDMRTVDLKKDGASISVDKSNVIEYIHLVADYKINKEMESECRYFRSGLYSVVPILKMFSWREMQTLISGSDKAIDIDDWMKFTHYSSGYGDTHPTIMLFWQVVHSFSETRLRKLLKFVTSCSRPPILGFKDLVPNFAIQNAGTSERLPTAATCMNLLKLPEYTELEVLREKLIYAIDAQAGFELS